MQHLVLVLGNHSDRLSLPREFDVRSADRAEALEAARELNPDIILFSCADQLAELEVSIHACRRLKSEAALVGIPVVILTSAQGRVKDRIRGLQAGADDVLPLPPEELLAARLHSLLRRKRSEDSLRVLAWSDPLTGLANRRGLIAQLKTLLGRGEAFAVLVADLDRFKLVNDRYGHGGGDEVLKAAARIMRESLRKPDFVCRMGGEEFLAVLAGAGREEVARVARRLHRTIAQARFAGYPGLRITISVGCAQAQAGDDPQDVIARADSALYEAKQAGRNRITAA